MQTDLGTIDVYRDLPGRPSHDLAFEGDVLEWAGSGKQSLLVYSWVEPIVILGYGQPAEDVDFEWCEAKHVPVFRRLTGGTGVVHCRDLAVSLALPDDHPWVEGIIATYKRFLQALAAGLKAVGADVEIKNDSHQVGKGRSRICFEDQLSETLLVGDKKVVGCAQARRKGGVLIHASVSLNLREELYAGAFRSTAEVIRRGLTDAAPGVEPGVVSESIARELLRSVGCSGSVSRNIEPSAGMLQRYSESRWAPKS